MHAADSGGGNGGGSGGRDILAAALPRSPSGTAVRAVCAPLDETTVASVAATLQALATPSRLRILTTLRHAPYPVGALAAAVGMEQSAVSHQLRLLRALGLVTGERDGRRIVYRLYDNHVAQLLDQAVHHIEHLRLNLRDPH
ncbi:metalloregulator ArsR/SmtB family transcription factor [Streptomyces sp. DT2A-34]|uniref:ArsR/SmtB family transcription factor n=1 Tax=Streptomyces sp. DT2A-34 TaxID=3051182 RepID=UPI00265BFA14|nr:metalloregulator ArsR/SmtB family transcription factor [Streptomyces sp. DT2A-34]MDO0911768.1 metalloregulator ArsR/SmtB family transcription factor [Streptomyces sp. DT2A-34]